MAFNTGLYNDDGSLRVTDVNTSAGAGTLGKLEDAAHTSADAGVFVLGIRNDANAVDTSADRDYGAFAISSSGQSVSKPYSASGGDWQYAAAASGISNTTTAVTIKAAAGASIRNYVTSIQIATDTLGAATELAIRDGAAGTVIWRTKLNTTAGPLVQINFPTPLKGTANTLLEVVTLTASVTGAVYFSAQGYVGP